MRVWRPLATKSTANNARNIILKSTLSGLQLCRCLHLFSCCCFAPYNCRLEDLLCLFVYAVYVCYFVCVCICVICAFFVFLGCFPLQLSPSVLWYCWLGLLTYKNRLPYNLYCVGGDVKHCTIQSCFPNLRNHAKFPRKLQHSSPRSSKARETYYVRSDKIQQFYASS